MLYSFLTILFLCSFCLVFPLLIISCRLSQLRRKPPFQLLWILSNRLLRFSAKPRKSKRKRRRGTTPLNLVRAVRPPPRLLNPRPPDSGPCLPSPVTTAVDPSLVFLAVTILSAFSPISLLIFFCICRISDSSFLSHLGSDFSLSISLPLF